MDHALAAPYQIAIMRHQNQGCALPGPERKEKIHDVGSGCLVEIAGGFIGKQKGGLGGKSPRQGNALLFAAGELAGEMREPVPEPYRLQSVRGTGACLGKAGKLQRHCDVFQRRHGWDQVKGLEDNADFFAAEPRKPGFIKGGDLRPAKADASRTCPLQSGNHHQQRCFSGPGRPHNPDRFPRFDGKRHPAQYVDRPGTRRHREMKILDFQQG